MRRRRVSWEQRAWEGVMKCSGEVGRGTRRGFWVSVSGSLLTELYNNICFIFII